MADTKQTIKEMATLVASSNRISEFHEKNMKMFPLVFFEGVREVSVEYDLSHQSNIDEKDKKKLIIKAPTFNNFVNYKLTIDPQVQSTHLDRRYVAIESSIRSLFWKNVIVRVYFNDKLMFESKNVR